MKNFLLLLSLILSFSNWAQETNCTIPPPNVSESSSRCPEGVAISISDFFYPQATQISIEITEVLSASTDFYMLPPDTSGLTTDIYSEGEYTVTLIIIETNPDTGENIECRSDPIPINVGTCADLDNDNDTYTADIDCNDENPNTYPGAPEICDGEDNGCNGGVDEGLEFKDYYWDADLDGYGNPNLIAPNRCSHPGGRYVEIAGDCNDQDPNINPGAPEECGDDIDNNCNEQVDEDCNCIDSDGDSVCDENDICEGFDDLADADGDEIPDGCDSCFGDNATGDADLDGICASDDNCDSDPDKTEPGTCGCGIADTDTDSDGTADCNDGCLNDPNKTEPGDCGCGIAETDTDGDGIPDCNDNCPNTSNPNQEDTNGDSIGDACESCPDSDNDGVCDPDDICQGSDDLADADTDSIPDGCDNCPNLANPNQEPDGDCDGVFTGDDCDDSDPTIGSDANDADCDRIPTSEDCDDSNPNIGSNANDADCDGVPTSEDCNDNDSNITTSNLNDSDNDGTSDCDDGCPNDRMKIAPGDCGCGVKEADRDNDGVSDCIDLELRSACPNDVDANGVSLDDDTDGVPNCEDLCPGFDDKLDFDGDKIPDGCDLEYPYCRGEKVAICHENNGRFTTVCVSLQQLDRHRSHPNDNLSGPCNGVTATTIVYEEELHDDIGISMELGLYPNPTRDQINVEITNVEVPSVLRVISLLGIELYEGPVAPAESQTIQLNEKLPPGTYIIQLTNGNESISKKVIVEN